MSLLETPLFSSSSINAIKREISGGRKKFVTIEMCFVSKTTALVNEGREERGRELVSGSRWRGEAKAWEEKEKQKMTVTSERDELGFTGTTIKRGVVLFSFFRIFARWIIITLDNNSFVARRFWRTVIVSRQIVLLSFLRTPPHEIFKRYRIFLFVVKAPASQLQTRWVSPFDAACPR